MLREPSSRFASYVYFRRFDIKSKYQRHGRDLVWSAKAFSNLYTRMLTNVQTGIQYNYKASQGCFSAKKILREKFAVVGTSERMLESLAMVGYVFHFRTFPVFIYSNFPIWVYFNIPICGQCNVDAQILFRYPKISVLSYKKSRL